jgi:uncharacterized integral membrane protein
MRLFKTLVILIIICFIGLFIYQNMETWKQLVPLKLNLYFNEGHDTKDVAQYMVILLSALIGFLAGLAILFRPHIRTRRLLKRERKEKKTLQEQVSVICSGPAATGEAASPAGQESVAEKKD